MGYGMVRETEVAREWNVGVLTMNKLSGVAETLVAREWQGCGKKVGISDFVLVGLTDLYTKHEVSIHIHTHIHTKAPFVIPILI